MNSRDCVEFKVNCGLSSKLYLNLYNQAQKYGWDSVHSIKIEDIAVQNWVRLKCRYGCTNYGQNWCCPPAAPEPEEVRRVLTEYSIALLLVGTLRNPEFYYSKSSRVIQVRQWKATISMERFLFLEGYYKAFGLTPGACPLCKPCNYPHECKFPFYRRPSVESFCIDFIETLENVGLKSNVAMDKKEHFNFYSLILVE